MSAELLREAAAKMRERAEAATSGPWGAYGHVVEGAGTVASDKHMLSNDAEHIASWGPDVALAVAAWLDNYAAEWAETPSTSLPEDALVIAVARAYLKAAS